MQASIRRTAQASLGVCQGATQIKEEVGKTCSRYWFIALSGLHTLQSP